MISVVIPAYNEEKNIRKTLDSLAAQKTKYTFEVIVVDNNSTDKTAEIVRSYQDKLPLHLIEEKKKGRSPARRAGFSAAKGDIIFSTDADTVVPVDWIEKMVPYFEDKKVSALTGRCKINDCGWFINSHFNLYQPLSMQFYRIVFGHYWLSGFNFAIRKNVYEKAGGFNTDLNSQEDTELAFRVKKFGKIKYVHNPYVIFSGRRFKQGFFKAILQYVSSWMMIMVLKKQSKTYLSDVR